MRTTHLLAIGAAVVALLVPGAAVAQETGLSGTARVGGGWLSGEDDSSKLQEYEVLPDGDAFIDLDLGWTDGDLFAELDAQNLLIDDYSALLSLGRRGGFRVSLFTTRNPRWFSNTGSTIHNYQGVGPISYGIDHPLNGLVAARFTIPPEIRLNTAVDTTGTFTPLTAYQANFVPVDLRYWRRTTGGAFEMPFGDAFTVNARYTDESRTGKYPINFSTYFSNGPVILEIPAPMDFKTRQGMLGVEYARNALHLAANATVSRFSNDQSFLWIENPNRLTDAIPGFGPTAVNGPAAFLASSWPDNEAFTVDFSAAYTFPMRHRLSVTGSWGEMQQDDNVVPWVSSNAAALATLPFGGRTVASTADDPTLRVLERIDGEIDTKLLMAKLTGDPVDRFGYSLSWRMYEVDNKTPSYTIPGYVAGDALPEPEVTSRPWGWEKDTLRAEVHFDPMKWLRAGLEYRLDKIDHHFREVEENEQKTWTLFADVTMMRGLSAHVAYSDQQNDIEHCEFADCSAPHEPRDLRRYDVADRDSRLWNAIVTWVANEAFTLSLNGSQAKHDYEGGFLGLREAKYTAFGAQASYVLGERVSLYANYQNEDFESDTAHRFRTPVGEIETDDPLDNWFTDTNDQYDTWGIGVKADAIPDRLTLGADLTRSKGRSDQACIPVPGGSLSGDCRFPTNATGVQYLGWPRVETTFTWLKTRAQYSLRENLAIGAEYWKYKFEGDDWQWDIMQNFMYFADPSTLRDPANGFTAPGTSMFLGTRMPDYDADVFRVYLDYHF